ncbi:peptidyl-tRNA hydrolase [Candidatus Blochmanniella floridana]|uniref:Peptidyl-tRNA hydrolase n=1 Tax=Blochmanniella floridana TaxID=203907 RepID=Q7VR77_BLOFL|nr:peptidyl-tRNA hydrolase [Candidatus Blochmannia floridanus]
MTIKLIAGIGNIGAKYINTRHNCGHKYIYLLSQKFKVHLKYNNILCGYIGKFQILEHTVKLLIPNSYVNNSGISVSKCVNFYGLSLREILVAHDELDLYPGTIKIQLGKRRNESHHGIQNIIDKLGNRYDFYRLRIGIGRPCNKNEIINFVLNIPSVHEGIQIDFIVNKVVFFTEDIVLNNFVKVMNQLHISNNIID